MGGQTGSRECTTSVSSFLQLTIWLLYIMVFLDCVARTERQVWAEWDFSGYPTSTSNYQSNFDKLKKITWNLEIGETVRYSLNARVDSLFTGLFFFTIRQKLIWKILFHRNANNFFPAELRASEFTVYDPVKHKPVFVQPVTLQAIRLPMHI